MYKFGNKVTKTKVPVPMHNDTIKEFFLPAKNNKIDSKNLKSEVVSTSTNAVIQKK